MLVDLYRLLPLESVKILRVLFPSFVTGLERESAKSGTDRYSFGGVRTFPLIDLIGHSVLLLARSQILPVILVFGVAGGLSNAVLAPYFQTGPLAGITTAISARTTHVAAALLYLEEFCIATTLRAVRMLLLGIESRSGRGVDAAKPPGRIVTLPKFLLLAL